MDNFRPAEMSTRMQVRAEPQERYWYPDDGGQVWVAGYQLLDEDGRYMGREAARALGLYVTGVAGAERFHFDALQADDAAPGSALRLVRDPENAFDANAVAVETAGGVRLGFVGREPAAELAPRLDAGEQLSAIVLREQRASPRDPRSGVTMLVAQGPTLELSVPRD
jgi:HIRAN domain